MMNKIEKLLAALIVLAEAVAEYMDKKNNKLVQMKLPLVSEETPEEPKEEEKPAPRKRASRAKKKAVEAPKEEIEEPNIADELGMNGDNKEEEKAELTEEETFEEMKVQIRLYLKLNVKETPDGKTKLSAFVTKQYKCAKLGDLVHDQRLSLLAFLVKKNEEGTKGNK